MDEIRQLLEEHQDYAGAQFFELKYYPYAVL
jgi:hypothetical protein